MKAVRLIIHQTSANYRKEESIDNKMTYPLPTPSMVIGAIHAACGYKTTRQMDVSIQGTYESKIKEPYTDYCFLNSVMDDRGILVKVQNGTLLSGSFTRVAEAKKSQGNSFENEITIKIINPTLLDEYQQIKTKTRELLEYKKTIYKVKIDAWKKEKAVLKDKKKLIDKQETEYIDILKREDDIKRQEKEFKEKFLLEEEKNSESYGRFKSVVTSIKYYEVLTNIDLIIHVHADDAVLNDILNCASNIKSIGRSEDFITLKDACMVKLSDHDDEKDFDEVLSSQSAYIPVSAISNKNIFSNRTDMFKDLAGTRYYLNTLYTIRNKQRIFQKSKAVYISNYYLAKTGNDVYLDASEEKPYIVAFLKGEDLAN